jgi:single-stranded DNA-binding protein
MAGENEVAKFSLAVNGYKDSVEFFDCEFWKPGGVVEYLVRGTQVLVEGEIQTQSWEKDGERKSKKIVKVMKVQLCGGKRREEPALEEAFSDFR